MTPYAPLRQAIIITLAVLTLGLTVAGCSLGQITRQDTPPRGTAVIYKSPECGCCVNYATYLEERGYDVQTKEVANLDEIKQRYAIPKEMESCHTTIIEDYIIEGHVPLETIDQLLDTRPDIKGIALPRMPSGSPGMPGPKRGPFKIYTLGTGEIFTIA